MSRIRAGSGVVRHVLGLLALGLALVLGAGPAVAAETQSAPDDRARFVSITRALEADPLQPGARADRAWALSWLVEAPDVSVSVCLNALGGMDETYPYAGEVALQYMFAMAVPVIEHPDMTTDPDAQQVAGVVSALRVYRALLAGRADARSPALDALLDIEARGGLPEFIRSGPGRCSAEG
ncbi:MAG: hypothetical protein EON85_00385 [Brevundimonas sp.]|nr:MAG: hypothetical protein EON85_00385 [Brevundimonas sp.]